MGGNCCKVLVFSTFRHTLAYLAKHTENAGMRYGLVHGDIPEDAVREISEGIKSRVRFNTVVDTGVPGFIPRGT